MKLVFHMENPADPELNRTLFAEFVDSVGKSMFNFVHNAEDGQRWVGKVTLLSVEGDHFEPAEPAERAEDSEAVTIAERVAHEKADDVAQRYLGNIEPGPREKHSAFRARQRKEERLFREAHPEWKPEKFNTTGDDSGQAA